MLYVVVTAFQRALVALRCLGWVYQPGHDSHRREYFIRPLTAPPVPELIKNIDRIRLACWHGRYGGIIQTENKFGSLVISIFPETDWIF